MVADRNGAQIGFSAMTGDKTRVVGPDLEEGAETSAKKAPGKDEAVACSLDSNPPGAFLFLHRQLRRKVAETAIEILRETPTRVGGDDPSSS